MNASAGAGVITLSGSLAQALPIYVYTRASGNPGVAVFDISTDGGDSFVAAAFSGASYTDPTSGITLTFTGSFAASATYRATVAQIQTYSTLLGTPYTFVQATASKQPILDRSVCGGQLSLLFDGVDDVLVSTTAGVASWIAGNDLPFTVFLGVRTTSAAMTNGEGYLVANSSSTTAKLSFGNNSGGSDVSWFISKIGDDGSTGGASGPASGGQFVTINTTYVCEFYSPGTTVQANINGATAILNFSGLDTNTASTINQLQLGGAHPFPFYVAEWAIYTGDQHVTATPTFAYLQTRYVDRTPSRPAESYYWDTDAGVASSLPATQPPNDYTVHRHFASLRFSVAPGTTSVTVWGVPTLEGSGARWYTAAVYLDESATPYTVLHFTGALGLKQAQTLTLDGAAHTVQIDEFGPVVEVTGQTLIAKAAPTTRVILIGDSGTRGFNADLPNDPELGWSALVKHALEHTWYRTTIHAIVGTTWANHSADAAFIPGLADGTNTVVVIALGTNDYFGQVSTASITANANTLIDGIQAALPATKIILASPWALPSEAPIGVGASMAQIRTAIQSIAAAQGCAYVDVGAGTNAATDLSSDGLHPNAAGYVKIKNLIQPVIEAQFPARLVTLTSAQYLVFKGVFRALLSGNRYAPNPTVSESTLFSFVMVLFSIAASQNALSESKSNALDTIFRSQLSDSNFGVPAAPTSDQLNDLFVQLQIDASGSVALPNTQYLELFGLLLANLSDYIAAYPQVLPEADVYSYFSQFS
jgi:lysophospholipase L1-like esterase